VGVGATSVEVSAVVVSSVTVEVVDSSPVEVLSLSKPSEIASGSSAMSKGRITACQSRAGEKDEDKRYRADPRTEERVDERTKASGSRLPHQRQ
jgi:hypothetical protein